MNTKVCLILTIIAICTIFVFSSVYAEESFSIFGDISDENIKTSPDEMPINISSRFAVKVPGKITKARLYTSKSENGTYVVELWNVYNESVIAGPYNWDIKTNVTGWQEFSFPEPIQISAGTDYLIAIKNNENSLSYSFIPEYFKNYSTNDSIFIVQDDGGLFTTSYDMPHLINPYSLPAFLRDVVFVPDGSIEAPKQKEEIGSHNSVYISDLDLGLSYSFGSELAIDGGSSLEDLVIGGKTYEKGFAMYASTHPGDAFLELNIEGLAFKTFASYVGIGDLLLTDNSQGSVVFTVEVDGVEVAISDICRYGDEAFLLMADITDGKILRLSVSDAEDGKSGDLAGWGDAVISKSTDVEEIYKEVTKLEKKEETPEPTQEQTDNTPAPTNTDDNAKQETKKLSKNIIYTIIIIGLLVIAVGVVIVIRIKRK